MTVTFVSYNIHKAVGLDRKRDPERILSVLREIDPDVIALQEADRRFGQRVSVLPRAALDDTRWRPLDVARRPRSIGWHGNALLLRRDWACVESMPLDIPTLEPRGAVVAVVQGDGRAFAVLGTHLDLSGLRRRDQIDAIVDQLEKRVPSLPVVVMGDFNQWGLRNGAMTAFPKSWTMIVPGRSYPSRQPLARLDRMVASPEWELQEAGVHRTALSSIASDHLPVYAQLSLLNN